MRIDPEQLARSAQEIGGCAEDLGGGLQSLQATVTTGNPWGQDEQGSIFGQLYLAVLGHALDALGSHAMLLATAADNLAVWAENVSGTDQQSAETFNALGLRAE